MTSRHIPPGPWDTNPTLWDRLVTNDKEWPGLAKVEVTRANKFDDKKAKGSSGAEREFSGVEPAKVSIEIRFWTQADYDLIVAEYLPMVEPNVEKKKLESVSISHSTTIARKVGAISVDSVKGPSRIEDGIWGFTIEGQEYRAPSSKNATGGIGGAGSQVGPASDCAALAVQLAQLQNDLKAAMVAHANLMAIIAGSAAEVDSFTDAEAWAALLAERQNQATVLAQQIASLNQSYEAVKAQQNSLGCNGAKPEGAADF